MEEKLRKLKIKESETNNEKRLLEENFMMQYNEMLSYRHLDNEKIYLSLLEYSRYVEQSENDKVVASMYIDQQDQKVKELESELYEITSELNNKELSYQTICNNLSKRINGMKGMSSSLRLYSLGTVDENGLKMLNRTIKSENNSLKNQLSNLKTEKTTMQINLSENIRLIESKDKEIEQLSNKYRDIHELMLYYKENYKKLEKYSNTKEKTEKEPDIVLKTKENHQKDINVLKSRYNSQLKQLNQKLESNEKLFDKYEIEKTELLGVIEELRLKLANFGEYTPNLINISKLSNRTKKK